MADVHTEVPAPGPPPPAREAKDDHRFRTDIQGLRALAILLVVAYHARVPGIDGGYVGVDVFFVVSGFLITGHLSREFGAHGRIGFAEFYARRIRRLIPASLFVLVATLALALLVLSPLELTSIAKSAQMTAIYGSNVQFARAATNYLTVGATDPFLHTWSLAVEEQFYFVWPLLMLAFMLLSQRLRRLRWGTMTGIAALSVVSFALGAFLTQRHQPWAFFLSPPRFWEFGAGALVSFLPAAVSVRRPTANALAIVGAVLVVGTALGYDDTTVFPGFAAAVPVLGTALLLVAGLGGRTTAVGTVLSTGPAQWLGRQSYSWYLWHWPLLFAVDVLWPDGGLPVTVGSAIVALAFSMATFRFVESALRHQERLVASSRLTILSGLAASLVCIALATGVARVASTAERSSAQRPYSAVVNSPLFGFECFAGFDAVRSPDGCAYGDTTASATVVVLGDSHAQQWMPAVDAVGEQRNLRVIMLAKASCPYQAIEYFSGKLGREYDECPQWREWAMQRIEDIRPEFVVLSSAESYSAEPGDGSAPSVDPDEWNSGFRRTTGRLERLGIPMVVIADTPDPGFDVPVCLSRHEFALFAPGSCEFDRDEGLNRRAATAEREVASAMTGTAWVDLTTAVCPEQRCRGERDGMIVYRDSNHLNPEFVRSLAPLLFDPIDAVTDDR